MNNVEGTQGIPLLVFGGAVPELAPEDLPEGASPYNQDCDFNPGSVFTRAGRVNQISYLNLFSDRIATLAQNVGTGVPWNSPGNATLNVPGNYASVTLGGTALQAAPVTVTATVAAVTNWAAGMAFFTANSGSTPTIRQYVTANFAVGTTFPAPVLAGSYIICCLIGYNIFSPNPPWNPVTSDTLGNSYIPVLNTQGDSAFGTVPQVAMQYAVTGAGNPTMTGNGVGSGSPAGSAVFLEVTGLNGFDVATPATSMSVNSTVCNLSLQATKPNTWPLAVWQPYNIARVTSMTGGNFLWFSAGATGGSIDVFSPSYNVDTVSTAANMLRTTTVAASPNARDMGMFFYLSDWFHTVTFTPNYPAAILNNNIATVVNAATAARYGVMNAGSAASITSSFTTDNVIYSDNVAMFLTFPTTAGTPVMANIVNVGGAWTTTQVLGGGTAVVPAGSTALFAILASNDILSTTPSGIATVTDNHSNVWFEVKTVQQQGTDGGTHFGCFVSVWMCFNPVIASNYTFTTTFLAGSNFAAADLTFQSCSNLASLQQASSGNPSEILRGSAFGFTIPATSQILGVQAEISGHQSTLDPSATLSVNLSSVVGSATISTQLPLADNTIVLGSTSSVAPWGAPITVAMLNSPTFAVDLLANSPSLVASFYVYAIRLRVYYTPSPPCNFNWIKTYEQTDAEIDTLALDANGVLWDEDVALNPTVLTSIFTTILPNTFAKSVTFQDIEYIAFSNLQNGTDVPRQWNATNLDRISMVGPGAYCSASAAGTGTGGTGNVAIQKISQPAPTEIRRIAWGTQGSPNDSTPGNLLVVFGQGKVPAGQNPPDYSTLSPYTPTFGSGTTVVLQGVSNPFPKKGGGTLPYNINGTYQVGAVSQQLVGGAEYCPTFTLPSPTTTWAYSDDFGTGLPSGTPPPSNWWYQPCLATIVTQQPLPNVGVNGTITISGTSSAYDGTWKVLEAPNTSQMTITSAQVNGGVATYTFHVPLNPGNALPQVGQTVSVQNCLNGFGAGTDPNIFNFTGKNISAVSPTTFSVSVGGGNITAQDQSGNAIPATATIAGNTFVFDAGQIVNFTSNSTPPTPVTSGIVVQQGLVGVGQRKLCYSFLTRSGYITQPSPINFFTITNSGSTINVSGLSVGPPNVVARIVFFTGAGGGNFFYIPQDVDVVVSGQPTQHNTKTIVNDNSSTTAQFSFSDNVLLSATAIDIPGNNLFNTIELGSCRGLLSYASRMFAWGEQTKVTNFRNLSFDGGYVGGTIQGVSVLTPLGWTIDPTNGVGGTLVLSSPVFGWTYQIQNVSGGVKAVYGMLTQGAAPSQTAPTAMTDEFGVPIIKASTLYSVRITASVTAGATGNLVVDLFSPGQGIALGTFSLPLNTMSTIMQIYTGTLLTTVLQPVPADLTMRVWAQNISNNATIQIDRVEPFETLVPTNTVALKGSYVNNQEAFDLQTGVCGPAQNMQPINGALELFDLLYALKEKSWFSTFDNGVTEPNKWNWKTVSNKVGCVSQNAYDWGEGWMLTADRQGVHFFEGGEPIKVSQEIQPLWDSINWQYGYTIWLRNDPEQRRFMLGIPIPTPNQWMPEFPVNANPTSPNVILMCNYRELNTGAQIAGTPPVRSSYMGRLMSPEPARKWSFWNIASPYADYIDRNNNQWPLWMCTGYNDSKIFALQASALSDEGNAINSFWISYGFVKPEMADAKGLGLWRMEFPYMTVLVTGSGTVNPYVYPESPFNPPFALDPLTPPAISQGDLELGVNIKGNRFFVRIGTNAVGAAFRLSKLVVPLIPDTWSPVRGWNAITA